MIKLSICISTFNRGTFIGETLDSILPQLNGDVELVVVDGGSSDDTQAILEAYSLRSPRIRYHRLTKNGGVDADFNAAVELAHGDYCWLMSDDDLFRPNAVDKVLQAIRTDYDAIVVNYDVHSKYFENVIALPKVKVTEDTTYKPDQVDAFFRATAGALSYIGALVIKRSVWMSIEREQFFGSFFIHLGVLFGHRSKRGFMVIAEPLIKVRYANAQWTQRSFEIWMFKWPQILWRAVGVTDASKQLVCPRKPWTQVTRLATLRALGAFSTAEYKKFFRAPLIPPKERIFAYIISRMPGLLINTLALIYYKYRRRDPVILIDLRHSRFNVTNMIHS